MRRLPLLLLALLVLLVPVSATAMPELRASATRVQAGDLLTIEWSRLPAGTHEVEFELSLDGGRWLRISPELDAHEGLFEWRVPEGLSGRARVRLRYGREHEEHEGGELALTIGAAGVASGPGAIRTAGEWWNVGEEESAPVSSTLGDSPRFSPVGTGFVALPSTPTGVALAPAPSPAYGQASIPGVQRVPAARAFSPHRSTPLRN